MMGHMVFKSKIMRSNTINEFRVYGCLKKCDKSIGKSTCSPSIDGYLEGIPHFQTDPGRVHGRKIVWDISPPVDCKAVPAGEQKMVISPTKWCLVFNKQTQRFLVGGLEHWKNTGHSNPN